MSVKKNYLIFIGVTVAWLLLATVSGWWLWMHYQKLTLSEAVPVEVTPVDLKVDLLKQAISIVSGDSN